MSLYLGFDTSNYTTSAALFDAESSLMHSARKLLEVEKGALGLRQRDALFMHTLQLPDLIQSLAPKVCAAKISAVAASTRPREADGSYMPCFLAGTSQAKTAASILGVPFFAFTHQQGHIAAGAWSAQRPDLLDREFLALHVSGGTTEILHVAPSDHRCITAKRIGGSSDLAAGQLVDRCGRLLGLGFPAGPAVERLALDHTEEDFFVPKSTDLEFSLSGLENKIKSMMGSRPVTSDIQSDLQPSGREEKEKASNIAYFVLKSITEVLSAVMGRTARMYPGLPFLCVGGVMSNAMIRRTLSERFGAYFALAEYSSDNAAGIAYLAARSV